MAIGHVWLVGAGPGDPGLVTLAGVRALAAADVVLYDALAPRALLRFAPAAAERVFVGKRAGQHAMPQDGIEALMVRRALEGRRVVRLKGGDPFVFGRGAEEALACRRAGVPFSVVPGVTAAIAAPAYAGIPVTHRGLAASVHVMTGSGSDDDGPAAASDWQAAARADTLVILMGAASLAENMERLIGAGARPGTPAACIRWGSRPDQDVVTGTVETIAALARERRLRSPMVTVVGEVAALAEELGWYVPGPLAGRSIVVTRARSQASELAVRFEALGADVVEAPVIAVRLHPENIATECVAGCWDWVVFASANAVEAFFAALASAELDTRALAGTKVAAVGEATAAALGAFGVRPDFVPGNANAEALAEELPRVNGARVFLPVSSLNDGRLAGGLRRRGAHVDQAVAYETVAERIDDQQTAEIAAADAVVFSSASTVRNLAAALQGQPLSPAARLVSIGPQTSAALRATFGRVDAEAQQPGLDALVEATVLALA